MDIKLLPTEELKIKWGIERFVKALGRVNGMKINGILPKTVEGFKKFLDEDPDAFHAYSAFLREEADKIIAGFENTK